MEYYNLDETGALDPQTSRNYRKFLTQMANTPPFPMDRSEAMESSGRSGGDSKDEIDETKKVNIDDFKLIKVIGKGSFGKVTLVEHKESGNLFAMKVLKKANVVKRKQVEHTRTERRVLGGVNHPFIVRLHFAFQTDSKLYFVLDYCPGGELFFHLSRMKKMPEHMVGYIRGLDL
jgi:serine/threonine protein kinase